MDRRKLTARATAEARMSGGGILQMGYFRRQHSRFGVDRCLYHTSACPMASGSGGNKIDVCGVLDTADGLRGPSRIFCAVAAAPPGPAPMRTGISIGTLGVKAGTSPFCVHRSPSAAEFHIDKLSLITCFGLYH